MLEFVQLAERQKRPSYAHPVQRGLKVFVSPSWRTLLLIQIAFEPCGGISDRFAHKRHPFFPFAILDNRGLETGVVADAGESLKQLWYLPSPRRGGFRGVLSQKPPVSNRPSSRRPAKPNPMAGFGNSDGRRLGPTMVGFRNGSLDLHERFSRHLPGDTVSALTDFERHRDYDEQHHCNADPY